MSVVAGETGFRVVFRYGEKEVQTPVGKFTRPVTVCVIEDEERAEFARGEVVQYFHDNNNRKVARREAFKKAVATAFPGAGTDSAVNDVNRPMRAKLWQSAVPKGEAPKIKLF